MSNDDNWGDDQYGDEYGDEDRIDDRLDSSRRPQKAKKGMSSGIKVVIVLVCVFGGLFVICCGVGIYFFSNAADSITDSPEDVIAITQDIVDIEIPEELFVPQFGMDLNLFVMQMKMVGYSSNTTAEGVLMLMEMKVSGSTPEEQGPEMRRAMKQQMGDQNFGEKELVSKETETRKFTIRGDEVEFQFSKAEDPDTGTAYREVTGVFEGKGGTAILILQIEEEGYDEDAIVKMIESIK